MSNIEQQCETSHACSAIAQQRNRFFTGKYMSARDFQDEQSYFLSRHRLHNRLFHGWGIACGLQVTRHPNPDCKQWVVVESGIAMDCCGRELILPESKPYELILPDGELSADQPLANSYLLCLKYKEKPIEYVPALYSEDACTPAQKQANRVLETTDLELCLFDASKDHCWMSGQSESKPCIDDCNDDLKGPCFDPNCPCGECVPLALLCPPDQPDQLFDIDSSGRRYLPTAKEYHTHIASINWPHGGALSLSELKSKMKRRLEIRFDRKLLRSDPDRSQTGINEYTFIVEYGGTQRALEFLRCDENYPPFLDKDDCTAVFTLDTSNFGKKGNISGYSVYIKLLCDFVLDCHGYPVDGNHLRGQLPSGNLTPGGVFESWFYVTQ